MTGKIEVHQSIILNNLKLNKYFALLGTMSSGKSTFLNSLIGFELFPAKNEACTAKIFSYYANPIRNDFLYLNEKLKKPFLRKNLDFKQLEKWNETDTIQEILIEEA